MAHLLEKFEGRVEMISTKREWHWFDTGHDLVDKAMTADEAMRAANMGWEVHQRPLYLAGPPAFEGGGPTLGDEVPSVLANVRLKSDGTPYVLGTVSPTYKPIQNRDGFELLEVLVGRGVAAFQTAGVLQSGRKVFVVTQLEGQIEVGQGTGDKVNKYLAFVNGHDGTLAARVMFTPIRIVCWNTLSAATGRLKEQDCYVIRHTGIIRDKITEAERLLGTAQRTYDRVGALWNRWREQDLLWAQIDAYFEKLFPEPPKPSIDSPAEVLEKWDKARAKVAEIRGKLRESMFQAPGSDLAGNTLWGAYNAVTNYLDHEKWSGSRAVANTKAHYTMIGKGAQIRREAHALAESFASV